MKPYIPTLALLLSVVLATSPSGADTRLEKKQMAVESIDHLSAELVDVSDRIWAYAETALRETRSADLLAAHAEQHGFTIGRGIGGMPTAFVATYGKGRPIIGLLGEYDALPGISQKASPVKDPLEPGAAGHGCGHNLFGSASLGAAIAVKELIDAGEIEGTIRFYGTPAEEAIGGKTYMVRDGIFDDLDVILAWHPDTETRADTDSSQAMVDLKVVFRGKTAHAAFDPWNGRSALDALELFTHGLNMLREHVRPTVRIHYSIVKGGDVPNVVPDHAQLWCWVRDSRISGVEDVLPRVRDIARGAALMAGVEGELLIQAGSYEMLVNMEGEKILQRNLDWLGPIEYSEEEVKFARAIQRSTGVEEKGLDGAVKPLREQPDDPQGGSTDVADVRWVVPTIHLTVTTAPTDAPWHSWAVVASGGMSIGHKGMVYAAKALATTVVDLFEDEAAIEAIRTEFEKKTEGFVYQSYLQDGPPPVPAR